MTKKKPTTKQARLNEINQQIANLKKERAELKTNTPTKERPPTHIAYSFGVGNTGLSQPSTNQTTPDNDPK